MPEHQQVQQSTESKSNAQKQVTTASLTQASNPYFIIQRAKINPKSLTHADIMQLQRTIGNRAVGMLLSSIKNSSTAQQATVQRQEIPEEEEPLQGKMAETIQRQEIPESEEESPLQGKFENKPEKEVCPSCSTLPIQRETENRTGMPDDLKAGVENLSGIDMTDVRVHYNSDKPDEVGALAYTQGMDIHVAPGQERHLPHEAWHVVQQAQGRVRPTMQLKDGGLVNDDDELEHEADVMGGRNFTSGQDVFFRQGAYETGSRGGQKLIDDELTHVVQQNGRAVQQMQERIKPTIHSQLARRPYKNSHCTHLDICLSQPIQGQKPIQRTSKDKLPRITLAKETEESVGREDGINIRDKILDELGKLIQTKRQKIEILERLQSQGDSAKVSIEDEKTLNQDEAEVSSSVTAMMLESQPSENYDPFIVEGETGFQHFLEDLQEAVANHVKSISRLKVLHLLFLEDGHYTPVRIEFGQDNCLRVFSVDASGTPKNFDKFQILADKKKFNGIERDIHFYSDGDVQKDNYHCESFSIDDLQQMAKMSTKELIAGIPKMHLPKISDDTGDNDEYYQSIGDVDHRFMYNAQSREKIGEYLKEYLQRHPPEDQELKKMLVFLNGKELELNKKELELNRKKLDKHSQESSPENQNLKEILKSIKEIRKEIKEIKIELIEYLQKRPPEDKNIKEMLAHISKYSILSTDGQKKNRSIDHSRYSKLKAALELVNSSSLEKVKEILHRRIYSSRDILSSTISS